MKTSGSSLADYETSIFTRLETEEILNSSVDGVGAMGRAENDHQVVISVFSDF